MELSAYERSAFERELAHSIAQDIDVFLACSGRLGLRCYALVSVGQCEEIQQDRQDESRMARWVLRHVLEVEFLFRNTPEAALHGIGPWLIELPAPSNGSPSAEMVHELTLEAGTAHALTLLASPLRLLTLAGHLRSWLHGTILPDPDIQDDEAVGAVLRWFDPGIGFDLVALWPKPQQRDFLRAFAWAGWNASFEPRGMPCSDMLSATSALRTAPLPLDKKLLSGFAGLNRANELLADVIERSEHGAFDRITPALQIWVSLEQIRAANVLGISDRESQISLLQHALTLHPDLSRLRGLKARLDEEVQKGGVLAHVLDAMPQAWWAKHRQTAPRVWAQWANHFLAPLQERHAAARNPRHPFEQLLSWRASN